MRPSSELVKKHRIPTRLADLDIITAHLSLAHLAVFRKRPIFEAVTPLPRHSIMRVLVLIPELDRNLIFGECEQLLSKAVTLLLLPFLRQETLDCGSSRKKRGAVSPNAIRGIRLGDSFRIPIKGQAELFSFGSISYWVFQRSCAFFTLACAVSLVKGGLRDILVLVCPYLWLSRA